MDFFNSLSNIKKWYTDNYRFSVHRGPTKHKHEECEPINNKRVCMDDSLVEIFEISNKSLSETDEVEITEPVLSTVPLRASPTVMLIEGRQHVRRAMSPVRTIDLNESNNDNDNIKLVRSYSLSNPQLISNYENGNIKLVRSHSLSNPQLISNLNASTKAIQEERSSIIGTKQLSLNMEGGFFALKMNDTSNNADPNKSMVLKHYVAPKPETNISLDSSSRSPISNNKQNILNQSKLSQTSGKENVDIPELSLHMNRVIEKELFYETILRKFKERQAAAILTSATTTQQKSIDDIFQERKGTKLNLHRFG